MHWRIVLLLAVVIATLLSIGISVYSRSHDNQLIQTQTSGLVSLVTASLAPVATPTSSPPPQKGFFDGIDSNILNGIIGGICTLVVGAIGAVITIRQNKQKHRLNLQNHQLNLELERIKKEHDEHLLNLRLEARAKAREERLKEVEAKAVRIAMEQARSIEEQAQAYRAALLADQRISNLQILGMSQPLKVEKVYVHIRVYQDNKPKADLDPKLRMIEGRHNPDTLLKAELESRKSRADSIFALDPNEAIRNNSRCVIVGDPGAGKTTLIKYLALKSVQNQLTGLPDLPILIELNKFINFVSGDLLDFAATQWYEDYGFPKDVARIYMEDNLKAGKALLLLDALDETMVGDTREEAEATYNRVANTIMKLSTRYHRSPIVVTARKAGYKQRKSLGGFTELEVSDFDSEDITEFVNNWFTASQNQQGPSKAEDLIKKMERNLRIQALAANPLLLSLIVIVYKALYDLPDRRADLYEQCVETLLIEWDAEREIHRRREFNPKQTQQLLSEISWEFHNKGQRYFPESDLLDVIAKFLPTIGRPAEEKSRVLTEMEDVHGLLKAQAWRWHGFLHLTLQEYFVTRYIVAYNKLDTLLTHLGDPWWEEIVLLYAAQVHDVSPLLQKLLNLDGDEQLQEDIFHTNLILAGRCLIDQPTVKQAFLREEVASRLFKTLMSTLYSLTKEQIINVLISIGGTASIDGTTANDFLLRSLTDESVDQAIRWRIAELFGTVGKRSIASKLLPILSDANLDQVLRQTIVESLGMLGEPSVTGTLLRLFSATHLDSDVQKSIVKALGMLGDRSIAYEMLNWLSNQHIEVHVRCSIAEALGSLGERSIVTNLLELLAEEHTQIQIRSSIAKALGMLGDHSIAPQLLALIADERVNPNVRYHIIETLGRLNGRDILPELSKFASNAHINLNIRKYITVVLGGLGEESMLPDLLGMLSDVHIDPYVRRSAADALSSIGNQSTVLDLLDLLANTRLDSDVRMSIAHTLGKLGDLSVIPNLLNLLKEHQIDPYVRRSIAEALESLGEPSVIPMLLGLLTDMQIDPRTRQIIVKVLGNLANDQVTVEALAALISTSDIAGHIYQAMWAVSRRARVRVFMTSGPKGNTLWVKGQ